MISSPSGMFVLQRQPLPGDKTEARDILHVELEVLGQIGEGDGADQARGEGWNGTHQL